MSDCARVVQVLKEHGSALSPVIPTDLSRGRAMVLDLSSANIELAKVNPSDVVSFSTYVRDQLREHHAEVAIGRYNEDRVIYRHAELFDGDAEPRSIHLGIDLFVPDGTPVLSPLPGKVHSFADNRAAGDYGPTVILEHRLGEVVFYTLYGHLRATSLSDLEPGQEVAAGKRVARVGSAAENGGWPPHLHFQIITDMGGKQGDFPGVAAPSERRRYLQRCPDPNLILRIGWLPSRSSGR